MRRNSLSLDSITIDNNETDDNLAGSWADRLSARDQIERQPSWDCPLLWLKSTHGVPDVEIKTAISKTCEEYGLKSVEVVSMFSNGKNERQHAYILLNNLEACRKILDGSIPLHVTIDDEDAELWFGTADHLEPNDHQSPNVLYIWGLPTDTDAMEIQYELEKFISPISQLTNITIGEDSDGCCLGWAKVSFETEQQTQRCIYMLNNNPHFGQPIRAAFCNKDRQIKSTPPTKKFMKQSKPKAPLKKKHPSGPKTIKPEVPKVDDGWIPVVRKKRH